MANADIVKVPSQDFQRKVSKFCTVALAGGTAAVISKTATAPIERIKLLLQAQDASAYIATDKRYKGIIDILKRVPKEQGLLSLWRGNMATIIRYFPNQALNFAFNDSFKSLLEGRQKSFSAMLLCGGLAGATSSLFTYWLDFGRTRLALDIGREKSSREFTGLWNCLRTIYTSDGIVGLYRGFTVSVFASFLYRASYFGCFDRAKAFCSSNGQRPLRFYENWAIAQVVTASSGMLAYPLDTVRRRMMMQSGRGNQAIYKNAMDCCKKICLEQSGLRGFYKGALSNIFRSIGGSLVMALYEEFNKYNKH